MNLRTGVIVFLLLYAGLGLVLELSLRRRSNTAQHFLHTNRDLPLLITSLSFLAANCSALEVLSMVALSAKYGMVAVHFYWIGAIPALAFLLCILLPRIGRVGIRSIPEYLEGRYSKGARIISALAFSALMVAIAGITLSLTAKLLQLVLGFPVPASLIYLGFSVVSFLLSGGLSAVLYAEALQLIIFLLVLLPITVRILRNAGGLPLLLHTLPVNVQHPFSSLPWMAPHANADLFGMVVGLGIVLSFTYWCGDFLLMQRLYAARTETSAMQTPVFAICAKLFLPLLLVLPGLWIRAHHPKLLGGYDLELPLLLLGSYTPLAAAAALSVVVVSLFLAVCGNVAAGVAILSSNLLMAQSAPASESSAGLNTGKLCTITLVVLALLAALLSFRADASMEKIQLVLSAFNVPVGVVFILGILFPRLSPRSGLPGIITGTAIGLLTWMLCQTQGLATGLNLSFYTAIFSCGGTLIAMLLVHALQQKSSALLLAGRQERLHVSYDLSSSTIPLVCLTCMLILYWIAEQI